jgi:folate-binding protein YgfZ
MNSNDINAYELDEYVILKISGADRRDFLQGQLTQDVGALSSEQSALTGWTNAKGRLLFVGQLIEWNDAIYLPLRAEIAAGVVRRLNMFVLRAEVSIELSDLRIAGLSGQPGGPISIGGIELPADPGACRSTDAACLARVAGDPARAWLIGDAGESSSAENSNQWQRSNIFTGLPEITTGSSEQFTPQMLNLDLLGAISFTKGCYVGQEIVARTQNLGRIKRRMYRFRTETENAFEPGQALYGPDELTGKIVSCAREGAVTDLLAVIAIESAEKEWFADAERRTALDRKPVPYSITA